MMKKSRNLRKKTVLLLLTAVILMGLLVQQGSVKVLAADLQNPRRSGNEMVTYDCIYFGSYPQSDASGNTKEPIKWRVLSVEGDDAFLVADNNLDAQTYHNGGTITWEKSTIRSWLNGYGSSANFFGEDYSTNNFIDRAFSEAEQSAIFTTQVRNRPNIDYGTKAGNDTNDKIFLLSIEEVTNSSYGFCTAWVQDKARERNNTPYVTAGGSIHADLMNSAGYMDEWWLRSPGYMNGVAAYVSGWYAYSYGTIVSEKNMGVCPALHLNLKFTDLYSYAGTVTCDNSQWIKEYSVIYILNGGTNADNPTRYFGFNKEDIVLEAPKRAGYSFVGWYTDKACRNKITAIKVSQKKDIVLYAKWVQVKKPGKAVIKTAVNHKKRQVKLSIRKVKDAEGYEIQYSTDSKLKKSAKNLTAKTTTNIIKSLKKSKTYYIRVRAYKTDSTGEKIYGSYSSIKKVKVKK